MHLTDTLNILSRITPAKAINALQILVSYYLSRLIHQPVIKGLPFSISVEPTTSCNLRCPECPSGLRSFTRPTGMLDMPFFKTVINQLERKIFYLTFYFQGEPYLHKQFLEMVEFCARKNIYTATSTNAHFLDSATAKKTVESGLDRLIISIDGSTQDVYQQYRIGGTLGKVLEGAKHITDWKRKLGSKTPHTIFQFLVVKPNEHQVKDIHNIAKKFGINEVRFKTAQVYDFAQGNPLIPTIDKYSRYKKINGFYQIKNKLLNQCWKMWHSCVITWDGLVIPCCFDKDAKHQFGNLKDQGFKQIWTGNKYNSFRKSLLKSRSEIDICKNCTEGTKVWA